MLWNGCVDGQSISVIWSMIKARSGGSRSLMVDPSYYMALLLQRWQIYLPWIISRYQPQNERLVYIFTICPGIGLTLSAQSLAMCRLFGFDERRWDLYLLEAHITRKLSRVTLEVF